MSKLAKSLWCIALACGMILTVSAQDASVNQLKKWEVYGTGGTTTIQDDGVIVCENKTDKDISGVTQLVMLNQKEVKPIEFACESKAENASGSLNESNYAIYMDIKHTDDTYTYGIAVGFRTGTHDWEKASSSYTPAKPIKSLSYFMLFRKKTGKVWFKNAVLIQK